MNLCNDSLGFLIGGPHRLLIPKENQRYQKR